VGLSRLTLALLALVVKLLAFTFLEQLDILVLGLNRDLPSCTSIKLLIYQMANTMLAVVLEKYGDFNDLEVKKLNIPTPPVNYVLVRMDYSTINVSDLFFIQGMYVRRPLPTICGGEGAGVVVASGGGQLADSLVGKRVSIISDTAKSTGTWAEYSLASSASCYVVDESISQEQAAAGIVNPMTVAIMLNQIQEGKHAAVVQNAAASSLGKMLIRACRLKNIPIVNIVRRQEQVDLLKHEGADHVLDSSTQDFYKNLASLCKKLNVTVGFDAVAGEATNIMLRAIRAPGIVYNYGALSLEPCHANSLVLLGENKRLEGLWLTRWLKETKYDTKQQVNREIQSLMKQGLHTHFVKEFSLDRIKEALNEYNSNKTSGKILLRNSQARPKL
jgi:NADPH2:quinone reductase